MHRRFLFDLDEGGRRRWLDITISPLRDLNKNLLGNVIIAHDTSREQELLAAEHHHTRQIETLNSITLASLETNTFHEMLQILADRLGELLEADGAFISLWDETGKKTIPSAAYGELREIYPKLSFRPGEFTLTESVLAPDIPWQWRMCSTPHT